MMNIIYRDFAARAALLAKDARGGIFVFAAVALPVVMMTIAGGVEFNRIQNAQAKLGAAVDAATQNVATMLEQLPSPETAGNEFFLANFQDGYMGAKLLGNKSGTGVIDISHQFVNKRLQVEGYAAADLSLTFGGFMGMDTYRIEHRTVVERVVKPNVEIVLTVDVSPSMCTLSPESAQDAGLDPSKPATISNPDPDAPPSGITPVSTSDKTASQDSAKAVMGSSTYDSPMKLIPDPNCTKLEALKLAMKRFVNHVFDNSAIESVKIGIGPYNHKARFADPTNIPASIKNAEAATPSYYTNLSDAEPLPAIVPLTTDRTDLLTAIDGIQLDLMAKGWTRTNLGTHVAALMLDPDMNQFFGGAVPAKYGDEETDKLIVQMTDGANNGCCFGDVDGDTSKQYMYLYKTDMDDQRDLCEVLKKPVDDGGGDLTLFSVVFDVKDTDYLDNDSQNISGIEREGGKWIKQVFQNCASNQQFYFDVPAKGPAGGNAESEIEKAYFAIASYLYKVRIVY